MAVHCACAEPLPINSWYWIATDACRWVLVLARVLPSKRPRRTGVRERLQRLGFQGSSVSVTRRGVLENRTSTPLEREERGGEGHRPMEGGSEAEASPGGKGRVFPLIHAKDEAGPAEATPTLTQTPPPAETTNGDGKGAGGGEEAGEARGSGEKVGDESASEAGPGDHAQVPSASERESIASAVALLVPHPPVGRLTTPPASPRDEWKSPKASPRSGSRSGRSSR